MTATPVPDLPNVDPAHLRPIDPADYVGAGDDGHPPRLLILCGSVRERSYSRLAAQEAARLLAWFGAEVRPLSLGGVRPSQGKTLALMQVCGGSQSFNTVNQMRVLGRWMRMVTIPNQSSIPKAWDEFDAAGRMRPSPLYMRIVDVMEELVKFTLMTRGRAAALTDRYSERVESAAALSRRVNQTRI